MIRVLERLAFFGGRGGNQGGHQTTAHRQRTSGHRFGIHLALVRVLEVYG
jgi:hypothetical protein